MVKNCKKGRAKVILLNAIIETFMEYIESRDNTAGGHVSRTSRVLKLFINEILAKGLYKQQTEGWSTEAMVAAARMHDIGKIAIDDTILHKPGKLTDVEFEVIKRHTLLGGEIIKEMQSKTEKTELLTHAKEFALYHHEKWDGTGYPHALAGENIPLTGRVMSLVDVYDALISDKPYKKAFTHQEAFKIINEAKGLSFDPQLTELFLSVSDKIKEIV